VAGLGHERVHQQLQPDRQREGLVRVIPAEGHELVLARLTGEHLAVGDAAHRDIADERLPSQREWRRQRVVSHLARPRWPSRAGEVRERGDDPLAAS
jgi:hypothetical protein